MRIFGNKNLSFNGYRAKPRKSMATRLAENMGTLDDSAGLVNGGDWAQGVSSGIRGFLRGYGAARDARNERAYDQYLQEQYEAQLAQEKADREQAQANAERDFNLKAISYGIDPSKIGQEGYLEELQQKKLAQAQAQKQAEYDRADAVAKQAHDYKMAQIAAANEYKKYELEGKKAAEEAEKKLKADKAAQEEAEISRVAENALQNLEEIAASGDLTRQGYRWANVSPFGGSETHNKLKGQVTADIAAIAPLVLKRAKEAGVSGINTVGEAMMYIGLPENPTSEQLAGALPRIRDFLGMAKTEQQAKQQSISDLW